MKMMSEKDRKDIISEVQKFGGISLRRQSLRVHKNGAKFPISKTYIDDELLDPEMTYTLILIPEIKIASKTVVTLSYFDRKLGPLIFYSYPEDNHDDRLPLIINIMDQAYEEGYYVHMSSIVPSSLNYYFEIPSEWARGNKEMLMISVILEKPISKLLGQSIQEICTDFATKLKNIEGLFKALYVKEIEKFPEKEHSDIKKISESLRRKIEDFYQEISISTKQE
ncbi:MAG: hypothetical protein R3255_06745 [Candidatus Lokiarchaeia archaeon]|nr:hypothetical protein [Candidatus Lokiarchaeia archaeon]